MDKVDARTKMFKEKLKKLNYKKHITDAIEASSNVKQVMEKIADFGMMSDAGNKKIARAVAQSKNEKDLRAKLLKISTMAKGKYAEAEEDEVFNRAMDAMQSKASGVQNRPDATMLIQLRKFKDITVSKHKSSIYSSIYRAFFKKIPNLRLLSIRVPVSELPSIISTMY